LSTRIDHRKLKIEEHQKRLCDSNQEGGAPESKLNCAKAAKAAFPWLYWNAPIPGVRRH